MENVTHANEELKPRRPSLKDITKTSIKLSVAIAIGTAIFGFLLASAASVLQSYSKIKTQALDIIHSNALEWATTYTLNDLASLELQVTEATKLVGSNCFSLKLPNGKTLPEEANSNPNCTNSSFLFDIPVQYGGIDLGKLSVKTDKAPLIRASFLSNIWIFLFISIGIMLTFVPLYYLNRKYVFSPIQSLISKLENGTLPKNLNTSCAEIEALREKLDRFVLINEENTKLQAEGNLMKQVSHDIRSPLAALDSISGSLKCITEDKRILIRNSINRIKDIANDLLFRSQDLSNHEIPTSNRTRKVELVSNIVDAIVSEKRIQFRPYAQLDLIGEVQNGYGLFAQFDSKEIKRVLSNLINNSAEALPLYSGQISVSMQKTGNESVSIIVKDNGKGIPENILSQLGNKPGVSYGKEGTESGTGLGIYHAKKTVEANNGIFKIQSKVDTGTMVSMTFKLEPAPKWFVETLYIQTGMNIVILDDDNAIHCLWQERFKDHKDKLNIYNFTSSVDFEQWILENKSPQQNTLFLMDFELLDQKATGLDLIEKHGLSPHAILVTSRSEEREVLERIEHLGIKQIQKSLAAVVPIKFQELPTTSAVEKHNIRAEDKVRSTKAEQNVKLAPVKKADVILLDDDSLVHLVWSVSADNMGMKYIGYLNANDLLKEIHTISPHTPIFIDSNLGHGEKGEDFSRQLCALGYKEIYITTGYPASEFKHIHWVKGVVGKDFPKFTNGKVDLINSLSY